MEWPSTPEFLLWEIANLGGISAAINVAKNLNCPPDLLEIMSYWENDDIAFAVASNPNTPEDVLRKLVKSDLAARDALMNPHTPIDAVTEAIFAENDHISGMALEAFKHRELGDSPSKRAAAAKALAGSLGNSDSTTRNINR